ncbi:MAG: hypothetical protein ACKVVT_14030 [Dehalococcoidia bacterium]
MPPGPRELFGQAAANSVLITGTDYKFGSPVSTFPSRAVDLQFANVGSFNHELVVVRVDGERVSAPLGGVASIKPGTSEAVRLTLSPGRYRFVCLLIGFSGNEPVSHLALGMSLEFEVAG